jgi:hypothetical protein
VDFRRARSSRLDLVNAEIRPQGTLSNPAGLAGPRTQRRPARRECRGLTRRSVPVPRFLVNDRNWLSSSARGNSPAAQLQTRRRLPGGISTRHGLHAVGHCWSFRQAKPGVSSQMSYTVSRTHTSSARAARGRGRARGARACSAVSECCRRSWRIELPRSSWRTGNLVRSRSLGWCGGLAALLCHLNKG